MPVSLFFKVELSYYGSSTGKLRYILTCQASEARRGPKQAWKPETQIEAQTALRSRTRPSKQDSRTSTLLSIANVSFDKLREKKN